MDDLTTWRIECSLTAALRLAVISSMAVRYGSGATCGNGASALSADVGDGTGCCCGGDGPGMRTPGAATLAHGWPAAWMAPA